ncbi:DUF6090 family protein [Psychroserpens ponticola]|uniref:DUF6090 family protein n=1 Tax=Psychroserpens ponticola TaxID=2932268 RepID=A0ABY7S6P6_9FLAO|nr:DUF6090 family protein [Psychroserpens ponticola]WCO03570.1 DUF6090 family protein [Psychroserpens ponticola]
MGKNKTTKYLKYAIGEIVLVVIGILIALGINNWSNEHTAKKELKEIYKQIQNDLIIDTTQIGRIVRIYEEKEERIQDILEKRIKPSFYDTISPLNYKDCKICVIDVATFSSFEINSKGYNLFNNNGVIKTITKDSLPDRIDEFYTSAMPRIQTQVQVVKNISLENIKDFQQYSWFVDWTEKRYNEDMLLYIFESETYRNQLASYKLFYKKNYIRILISYKEYAGYILGLIELEQK